MLILSRIVHRIRYEECGKRTLLDYCLPGDIFSSEDIETDPIQDSAYLAGSSCSILKLLQPEKAQLPDSLRCILESRLRAACVRRKARLLKKADILSRGTVREKILACLGYEMIRAGSLNFDIPLSRQVLF